ncbi:hypothetical protein HDU81_011261, partial [Chytriomyces hyalinus]
MSETRGQRPPPRTYKGRPTKQTQAISNTPDIRDMFRSKSIPVSASVSHKDEVDASSASKRRAVSSNLHIPIAIAVVQPMLSVTQDNLFNHTTIEYDNQENECVIPYSDKLKLAPANTAISSSNRYSLSSSARHLSNSSIDGSDFASRISAPIQNHNNRIHHLVSDDEDDDEQNTPDQDDVAEDEIELDKEEVIAVPDVSP